MITNGIGMRLTLIPAGEFVMGSPEDEEGRFDGEGPQHRVRITKPFYLGQYEVTQGQYEAVMGSAPSQFKGADRPVECVSWEDAVEFCRKLSLREGLTYRLPTEAEWEYACRAGATTKWCCGDDESALAEYAWNDSNANVTTHPVGQKKANAWELHDMHGNVWEWCADWYRQDYYANSPVDDPPGPATGSYRVFRGGGWFVPASFCRSACRYSFQPSFRYGYLGFRVATVP